MMNGYVAQRRGRFYAVIYEGLDPITGRERRRWYPAGTDRAAAQRLAARLAADEQGRADAVRALTFGAYLTSQWLPAKRLQLAASTYRGYERNVQRHILPSLGRVGLRRLRYHHIEALYDQLLTPSLERPAPPPRLSMRSTSSSAAASPTPYVRGLLTRNVALLARSPRLRAIPKTEAQSWTDAQLRQFLRTAADHRFFSLFWVAAMTGMRRNEVLGLKWDDIDFTKRRLGLNRGLVAIGYDVHQTRGKTRTSRRPIDLDTTTLDVLAGWRAFQQATFAAVGLEPNDGWVFTDGDGNPLHPHALSQAFERVARRAGVPVIRLHDLRHTHGSLLIKEGVPVKVVRERLGHANIAFTIQTYQHVLPGMQANAARTFEQLTAPVPPATTDTVERRTNRRKNTA
jgi:integrase